MDKASPATDPTPRPAASNPTTGHPDTTPTDPADRVGPAGGGFWGLTRREAVLGAVIAAVGGGGAVAGLVVPGGRHARGAGGGGGPGVPTRAELGALLARQAAAVRERDRAAFLATVDARRPGFRDWMGASFDGLARLPVAGWRQSADALPALASGAYGAVMRVTLSYRFEGFDRSDTRVTRYLTVTRHGGGPWAIAGDGSAAGFTDDAQIWDYSPLTVVRGRRSLVAGAGAQLQEVGRRLEAAVPVVSGVVGDGWARAAVAFAPADDQQLEALLGGGQGVRDIAALASSVHGQDRIIIAPDSFGRLNALGRRVVLTHELTHIAMGATRDTTTPIWLVEGLADYVGYKGTGAAVKDVVRELKNDGRVPAALPGPADFGDGSDRLPQAYEEAWLACRMIAERYGEKALVRLYRAAGQQDQDAAVRTVLNRTLAQLTADWRAYVRQVLTA